MRFTIIKDDNAAYVGGVAFFVDCSALPSEFHALQWYDTYGEVEFKTIEGVRAQNEIITDISPYQSFIDSCNVKKSAFDAAVAAAVAAAAIKPTSKGSVNVIA